MHEKDNKRAESSINNSEERVFELTRRAREDAGSARANGGQHTGRRCDSERCNSCSS